MELAYCKNLVTLWHGDSLDMLRGMEENSVDMIYADPPYNLSNGGTTCKNGKRVKVDKGDWDKSSGVWEDFKLHLDWITLCLRALKPEGTIWISGSYHSIYQCGFALQMQGARILNEIAWFKPNAAPNIGCRCLTASHESIIWARKSAHKKHKHTFHYKALKFGDFPKDKIKKKGKQMRSCWWIPATNQAEKIHGKHPTQKPIALLDRIVMASTNPRDTIVDPFLGSGTTALAATKAGRIFVGCDLDREHVETSIKRVEAHHASIL